MSKSLRGLLLALIATVVAGSASAESTAPKTNLNVALLRDKANVPALTTWHQLKNMRDNDLWGIRTQATVFYGRSTNGSHIAKNFGANGSDNITVYSDSAQPELSALADGIYRYRVAGDLLAHFEGSTESPLAGNIKYDPKQTVVGARLDVLYRADKLLDGLYFGAIVPVHRVKNDLGVKISAETDISEAAGNTRLLDLLYGNNVTRADAKNVHTKLNYGKMCSNSRTSLGDIEVYAGWNFLEGEKYHVGFNAGAILPTSGDPKSEYLWAARMDDNAWGIRLGTDAHALLWEDKDQSLTVHGSLLYKYRFSSTERRTLGLKSLNYGSGASSDVDAVWQNPILSHLFLVGTVGSAGLQPLANVSTLDVKVKGRSQLEADLSTCYKNGGFTLDIGCGAIWREREDLSLKSTCTGWTDQKFGVANKVYDAQNAFGAANTLMSAVTGKETDGLIKTSDLDLKAASAASQLVWKAHVGVGYTTKTWDYPVSFGAGAGYELPGNNRDALEGYSLWAKAGIAF
jgi:hypothetical protein